MSILPTHRAKSEKAIDEAAATRFEALPLSAIDTNPATCEESVLRVLAVAFVVNIAGLELEEARQAVLSAFEVSRHKGTLYAVKTSH